MARISAGAAKLHIVPANAVPWGGLRAVAAARCHDDLCFCQRFKILTSQWCSVSDEERAHRLRTQAECGHPDSDTTNGLVGYLAGEPVAWCAIEPRTAYIRLTRQVTWAGRNEDETDGGVWAVTCLATRTPYCWQGFTYQMAAAAVEFARERGAHAVEGYGMLTEPGKVITWGELHVGSRNAFAAAGFREVTRPTKRRVVMRIDLADTARALSPDILGISSSAECGRMGAAFRLATRRDTGRGPMRGTGHARSSQVDVPRSMPG